MFKGSKVHEGNHFGIWALEFGIWILEFGTWYLELGTWNFELESLSPRRPSPCRP